jgi:hypothetical protein
MLMKFVAPLKLKVGMGNIKMLIPYAHPNNTISQLMEAIVVRFARYNPTPGEPFRIAELLTNDGYQTNRRRDIFFFF